MTREEVRNLLGTPSSTARYLGKERWQYGESRSLFPPTVIVNGIFSDPRAHAVYFDTGGRVKDFREPREEE